MPKVGNHTPAELATRLQALKDRTTNCRRENYRELLPELESLAALISTELRLDSEILQKAKARYKKEFSLLERINPFSHERQEAHRKNVAPVKNEVSQDRALLSKCCELLEWVRNASQAIEWRKSWHGGVYGVYNAQSGQTEWRQSWHSGIAGVYHPDLCRVEWRETWRHGVAGVFNPISRVIEWRENWHGGVAGVYNPKSQTIEWREKWHHGVCGVFHPVEEQVIWKEAWKAGVAGAWCNDTKEIKWEETWKHGAACVYFDGSTYQSTGSYYGDEDDD